MDLDFITDVSNQFSIAIGTNPQQVSGNRALLNRFEITFLTKTRRFLLNGDKVIVDNFGGDAVRFISMPQVLNNPQSIAAAVSVAIDNTVKSLKGNEPPNIPNTEKISGAKLISIAIEDDGYVYAEIEVIPVEKEFYEAIKFNLPITRRG